MIFVVIYYLLTNFFLYFVIYWTELLEVFFFLFYSVSYHTQKSSFWFCRIVELKD